MTLWYLDTSAALKLIVEEAESAALAEQIAQQRPKLISSWLIETELRRAAIRNPALPQVAVTNLLDSIALEELTRADFHQAGLLPGNNLRSLDALHIATALRCDCDLIVSYDVRLLAAAADCGLRQLAPGYN